MPTSLRKLVVVGFTFHKGAVGLIRKAGLSQKVLAAQLHVDPSTLSKFLHGTRTAPMPVAEALADRLSCDLTALGTPDSPSVPGLYTRSTIESIYDDCGEADVVAIVSRDGFLEADDRDLFDRMLSLVQKGVELRYFYPSYPHSKSIQDFVKLSRDFGRVSDSEGLVHGYQVSPTAADLLGWNIRYVITAHWNEDKSRQHVKRGLVYVGGAEWRSTDRPPLWIELTCEAAAAYYRRLNEYAEPISGLGTTPPNRLNTTLQRAYRLQWSDAQVLELYAELRARIATDQTAQLLLRQLFDRWWTEYRQHDPDPLYVRVLDIGPGDSFVTETLLAELQELTPEEIHISPTLLEPAAIPVGMRSSLMNRYNCVEKALEEFDPPSESYDVILSIHSSYLLDPGIYLKIYNMLSRFGLYLQIVAPYEGNAMNTICSGVDNHILQRTLGRRPVKILGKVVDEDEWRMFAEDAGAFLARYFQQAVERLVVEQFWDESLLLGANGEPTDLALRIADMFAWQFCRGCREVDGFTERLRGALAAVRTDRGMPMHVWGFGIRKAEVRRLLGTRVVASGTRVGGL